MEAIFQVAEHDQLSSRSRKVEIMSLLIKGNEPSEAQSKEMSRVATVSWMPRKAIETVESEL